MKISTYITMSPKKEIYPEWLSGYQVYDFLGGYNGISKTIWLNENLSISKERFPDGWLFVSSERGLSTSILCLRGMVAIQSSDLMGAIYREETGELVKAKFSVRTLFSKYDSHIDSLISLSDQEIVSKMYDSDTDWICEVEMLKGLPVLNLAIRERSDDGSLSVRHMDSGRFDPSRLGSLLGVDYPSYHFIGRLGYFKKTIYLRIFEDRVSIGIVEDRGGDKDTRVVHEDDYREMFVIKRQNLELSRFGNKLTSGRWWMPGSVDEINEVLGSVCPDFVYESGDGR